jgi:osmotically-inducible protein OsmY
LQISESKGNTLEAKEEYRMLRRSRYLNLVVCCVWVITVIGCAGSRNSRSTGEFVDDSALANKVKVALYADEEVSGTQIEVEVFKGVVQLSGFVDNAAEARKAVQIAQAVNGVKEVRNSLIVK